MKYIVSRTSAWHNEKPCEEAYRTMRENWHTRTCDEDEYNRKFSNREGLWRGKGKNHSITSEGWITRQEEDKEAWAVDINGLKKLMQFVEKHSEVVLSTDNKTPHIEIYDDYRE